MAKTFNPSKYANTVQGAPIIMVDPRSSAANQWFGQTACTSAVTVISTTVIKSDSIVFTGYKSLGTPIAIAGIFVTSLAQSASFTVITSIGASSGTLFWEIKNVH